MKSSHQISIDYQNGILFGKEINFFNQEKLKSLNRNFEKNHSIAYSRNDNIFQNHLVCSYAIVSS